MRIHDIIHAEVFDNLSLVQKIHSSSEIRYKVIFYRSIAYVLRAEGNIFVSNRKCVFKAKIKQKHWMNCYEIDRFDFDVVFW